MVFAGLHQDDFIEILNANGYQTLSDEYWDVPGIERIVMGKDGHTFTLKLRKFFFYPEVISKFESLKVNIIPEKFADEVEACRKAMAQDLQMRIREAERRLKSNQQPEPKKKGD